jgi:hypothetical protein
MKKENMLLLGAAGRNSGKTLLACLILELYSPRIPIIGIKVTTIHRPDLKCPKGGEGCGVCTSLEGAYCITEETDRNLQKDTSLLLASGARQVFWLRAHKAHLSEGLEALFDLLPDDAALICESNSVRTVVEPGVFLLVKNRKSRGFKPSAREVRDSADRIVEFDPEGLEHLSGDHTNSNPFDLNLDTVQFIGNGWVLKDGA